MRTPTTITALFVATLLSAPVHALEIDGNVLQSIEADNIVNFAAGKNIYARQDLNTIYDNVTIGGDVEQTIQADNIVNFAAGVNISACQSINVIGQQDCAFR